MPDKSEQVFGELTQRISNQPRARRLEPTRRAAELLGNPQDSFASIHITGTNGKTSTARILESLVRAHGLRTGLFTSPHLYKVNERIVIDGEPISDDALYQNWQDIQWVLQTVDAELYAKQAAHLTYFEALTILALAAFADAPVDVAIIEVGMGGEWDSTNIIDANVAVFTPISLDHTYRLGKTEPEIAETKAGIIKPGAQVVTSLQNELALSKLRAKAEKAGASFKVEGIDFGVRSITTAIGGQLLSLTGVTGDYEPAFLPLFGDHQAQNAAVAVAAVEALLGAGQQHLSDEVIAEGLAKASSPGRLQVIHTEPTVLVDAAHNPAGAHSLSQALSDYFNFDKIIGVMAVLADKDADGIFSELAGRLDLLVLCESKSVRAAGAYELADIAEQYFEKVIVIPETYEAIEYAKAELTAESNAAILITGSISLVSELGAYIRDEW